MEKETARDDLTFWEVATTMGVGKMTRKMDTAFSIGAKKE